MYKFVRTYKKNTSKNTENEILENIQETKAPNSKIAENKYQMSKNSQLERNNSINVKTDITKDEIINLNEQTISNSESKKEFFTVLSLIIAIFNTKKFMGNWI